MSASDKFLTGRPWNGDAASHPLDGVRGKLVRAVQHADHLALLCAKYSESTPVQLVTRFERDAHYVFVEGTPPPEYLGSIFGEIIHDLRSALDQLAWRLAALHLGDDELDKPAVGTRIYFPIRRTRAAFLRSAQPYFHPNIVEALDAYQPYHNEGTDLTNPLEQLQDFSNADKHRGLVLTLAELKLERLEYRSTVALDDAMVDALLPDGISDLSQPLLRIRAPADAHIEFSAPTVEVGFSGANDSLTGAFSPDEDLRQLCGHIIQVVDFFGPLYPPVDWPSRMDSWITPGLPTLSGRWRSDSEPQSRWKRRRGR